MPGKSQTRPLTSGSGCLESRDRQRRQAINFDLQEDEALIVRAWPMSGNDQGIQLADAWFSSREYGNRQSSLSGDQSHRAPDGPYYLLHHILAGPRRAELGGRCRPQTRLNLHAFRRHEGEELRPGALSDGDQGQADGTCDAPRSGTAPFVRSVIMLAIQDPQGQP